MVMVALAAAVAVVALVGGEAMGRTCRGVSFDALSLHPRQGQRALGCRQLIRKDDAQ